MSLRAKFNLALLAAFVIGLVIGGGILRWVVMENARQEVLQTARLMMQSAAVMRDYTAHNIEPLLANQMADRFLPESIPFFAAQVNFRALQKENPDYAYKEATLNPTNPSDRAADWEADIINVFRRDAKMPELVAERQTPTGPSLSLSRPIQITDNGCLVCHSTPAAAPASMIKLYGSANGFGWQPMEVVGASIVSVPMAVTMRHAEQSFLIFMGVLTGAFVVFMIVLNVLLHHIVLRPVTRMSRVAEQVSLGKMDVEEYQKPGKDEIASLSVSFNRMRRSLESAMSMLDR